MIPALIWIVGSLVDRISGREPCIGNSRGKAGRIKGVGGKEVIGVSSKMLAVVLETDFLSCKTHCGRFPPHFK